MNKQDLNSQRTNINNQTSDLNSKESYTQQTTEAPELKPQAKTCVVILMRNAERIDQSPSPSAEAIAWKPGDPYITTEGEKMAYDVGREMQNYKKRLE